ncbi:recombinase family protein [Acinetobacter johnsonii]|uniref:Recombinase family protein n=1 Tax=Acinetobacter johnsonii TaxID=40214 RepID=A0AA42MA20_ACIJO|nr:recombinase family protein [Acinetobacter johnsonii]MDH0826576.1 recombinase family protein [Acinetobacter johnsonii]
MAKNKQAIGYVRVSTQKQVDEGVSIDAQVNKIKAWASLNDYEVVEIFIDEGISGKNTVNRPQLNQALSMLKNGMAFVFYSLSRVSRNVVDTIGIGETIHKKGADMVSLSEKIDTTDSSGRMFFNIMAVLNQFERDQISDRTKLAINHKRSNLKVFSHTPYGFDRNDDDLIPNPIEQDNIQIMKKYRELGYGTRKIATLLNKSDIKSKHGGKWYSKTVEQVLNREKLLDGVLNSENS